MQNETFEVIVIGGGHAGVEAAAASARMGASTLLITQNVDTIGQMSCNPAIGGIGKGHLVKEIDALDGIMARAIDRAGIQFRILNVRKGVAVQATRAQADRSLYRQAVQDLLKATPNLTVFQSAVDALHIEHGRCAGVVTTLGQIWRAQSVVLAVGTFLGGRIHIGDQQQDGGRAGDAPSNTLSKQLRAYGWPVGRLKTGTPPRIDVRSIDFSCLEKQPGDQPLPVFSFLGEVREHPQQVPCHISMTTPACHDIIRTHLHQSAMFSGNIEGVGPRYCPSIEDKVHRFDRDHHQVFLEPEGLTSFEVYPNGVSTSLPFTVQQRFIRAMVGLEKAWITRPGYAIEYDYFDPQALTLHLETRSLPRLFLAGQINGTTGYEEAAAQGLIAGVNAVLASRAMKPWVVSRSQGYMGVMIDDLVTQGTQEPYRMFTSRAEYRLLLREDNADERLTPIGYDLGVVSKARWQAFQAKQLKKSEVYEQLENMKLTGADLPGSDWQGWQLKTERILVKDLFKQSHLSLQKLQTIPALAKIDQQMLQHWVTQARYEGYIIRQQKEIQRQQRHANMRCQTGFDYAKIVGLSAELVEKLNKVQPNTIGQASRISGMTPAALSLLMVWFKKHNTEQMSLEKGG